MSDYSIKDDYNKTCSQVEKKEWGTFPFHLGNFWHSGIHFDTTGQKKYTLFLMEKLSHIEYEIKKKKLI